MAYQRKTVDTFEIQCNYGYGHGWETECIEDTRKEARAQLKTYRANSPYPVKIVKKRVKKVAEVLN